MLNGEAGVRPLRVSAKPRSPLRLRPAARCKQTGIAQSGLKVGFEEPEVLVEFTSERCEQITGDGIAEIVGFLHRGAQRVGMMGHVVH